MNQREPNPSEFDKPQRTVRQNYKFSQDEIRVLKECNRESFYQRCLPVSAILGASTYYGIKTGFLRPSPRFGAVPKVALSVIVGYFIGKFSYQSKCAEKLMQLPNSQFGEILRRRRQGNFKESLDSGFGPAMSLGPFSGMSEGDTYSDVGPGNVDADSSRSRTFDGLDDSQRPSMDNPIYEEEMPPVQKHVTTYEELRKQNREEYQQKRTGNFRETGRPTQQSNVPSANIAEAPKNKYGDPIE